MEATISYLSEEYANPSQLYAFAKRQKNALKESRQIISDIIYQRNGADNDVPGNISLSFLGHSGESILHRLDLQGICISTGSACNSKDTVVSHVLKAIGLPDDIAQPTVKISLGKDNSEDEIISIVESLSKL